MKTSSLFAIMVKLYSCIAASGVKQLTLRLNMANVDMIPTMYLDTLVSDGMRLIDCAAACLHNDGCISIFYRTWNKRCYGYKFIVTNSTRMVYFGQIVTYEKIFESKCTADGFTIGDGICFREFVDRKTWDDAQSHCQTFGGHLLVLKTEEKYQRFITYVEAYDLLSQHFIGLSDKDNEGTMEWVDGTSAANFGFWADSQPDNFDGNVGVLNQNNADCAILNVKKGEPALVTDGYCLSQLKYFCEVTL